MGSAEDEQQTSVGLPFAIPVLHPRVELAGLTISDQAFDRARADRAVIANTIFRGCTFVRCSFRTADFEAVVFEGCRFDSCDFSTADFRSSEFARCQLTDCNFAGGAIKASLFQDCQLSAGKFGRQAIEANSWQGCVFLDVDFRRATLLHMYFSKCRFVRTSLADCTSLYHFFHDCDFEACRMNADGVALSFGLSRENLSQLVLVWQGLRQRTPRPIGKLLDALLHALSERRWAVAAASLAINFGLLPTLEALRLAFSSVAESMTSGRRLRRDEIEFLSRLVRHLAERNELPFLALAEGLRLTEAATLSDDYNRDPSIFTLGTVLKEAELEILRTWEETRGRLAAEGAVLRVEFTFEARPQADLLPVLTELGEAINDGAEPPKLLQTRRGSYVEVLTLTLGTLMSCVICLGMLVRIVDRLIDLRARTGVLVSRKLPATVRTRALQPLPSASTELVREVSTCLTLLSQGQLPALSDAATSIADQLRSITVSAAPASPPRGLEQGDEGHP
ncbi:MAG: pentapeptide repeat-containing protein [Pseudomonadota bacterium]|nr:pentapeptide repeat-containing protein [Pseudomonadota bacterium]